VKAVKATGATQAGGTGRDGAGAQSPRPPAAAPAKAPTMEEWLAMAPEQARDIWNSAVEAEKEQRTRLVEAIVANAAGPFTKEELQEKPLGDLKKLARLAGVNNAAPGTVNGLLVPDYRGAAVPLANAARPQRYASEDELAALGNAGR